KHNDLCFEFSILDEIVTPEPVKEAAPVEAKPAAASEDDMEAQLLKLKQLYDGGLIDEDEYKEKKSKVLGL
ncbi:MAG: SHOCT domain-containing protein, partial [Spirochaetaceae bacterium]|nr:SHOCT domain-containing protein [Spirochaetaceae bacterium]